MADEIELVGDDDGLVFLGDRAAVEWWLDSVGQLSASRNFPLDGLWRILDAGGEIARTASDVAENSARYLKLTKESAHLRREFGLIPTDTPDISYAMVGEPGSIRAWLKTEDGPRSLLTNPAVLRGIGGLMTQVARQAEADELRALLERIDGKLDDVRREQKNRVLAKLGRARDAIEEAMAIREHGGHRETAWGKIQVESGTILEVQKSALGSLDVLADKLNGKNKVGKLAKATREIECEVHLWLAVLAYCFQLEDELRILEIDHVLDVAPADLDGHRRGLGDAQRKRRQRIVVTTDMLIDRVDQAGAFADSNVLLHCWDARSVINSVNSVHVIVQEFHASLGLEAGLGSLEATRWRDALRDPGQRKNAGAEAKEKTENALALAATAALIAKAAKRWRP